MSHRIAILVLLVVAVPCGASAHGVFGLVATAGPTIGFDTTDTRPFFGLTLSAGLGDEHTTDALLLRFDVLAAVDDDALDLGFSFATELRIDISTSTRRMGLGVGLGVMSLDETSLAGPRAELLVELADAVGLVVWVMPGVSRISDGHEGFGLQGGLALDLGSF